MAFNQDHFGVGTLNFALTAPNQHTYNSGADITATVAAANYFDNAYNLLSVNDVIYCSMNNNTEVGYFQVTALAAGVVTVAAYSIAIGAGAVGTANLAPLAVTTAILDNDAVTSAKIAANTITSDDIATDVIQYVKVPLTAAQFNGMYAAPFVLIAAPGVNKLIRVHDITFEVNYGGAAFAAGGVVAAQYGATANGLGAPATATTAAAVFIAFVADGVVGAIGSLASATAAAAVNAALYLSNQTGAFTTGTSTVDVHISYSIVTTTF